MVPHTVKATPFRSGALMLTRSRDTISCHHHRRYNTFADTCPNRDDAFSDSPPRAFRNTSGIAHLQVAPIISVARSTNTTVSVSLKCTKTVDVFPSSSVKPGNTSHSHGSWSFPDIISSCGMCWCGGGGLACGCLSSGRRLHSTDRCTHAIARWKQQHAMTAFINHLSRLFPCPLN